MPIPICPLSQHLQPFLRHQYPVFSLNKGGGRTLNSHWQRRQQVFMEKAGRGVKDHKITAVKGITVDSTGTNFWAMDQGQVGHPNLLQLESFGNQPLKQWGWERIPKGRSIAEGCQAYGYWKSDRKGEENADRPSNVFPVAHLLYTPPQKLSSAHLSKWGNSIHLPLTTTQPTFSLPTWGSCKPHVGCLPTSTDTRTLPYI